MQVFLLTGFSWLVIFQKQTKKVEAKVIGKKESLRIKLERSRRRSRLDCGKNWTDLFSSWAIPENCAEK